MQIYIYIYIYTYIHMSYIYIYSSISSYLILSIHIWCYVCVLISFFVSLYISIFYYALVFNFFIFRFLCCFFYFPTLCHFIFSFVFCIMFFVWSVVVWHWSKKTKSVLFHVDLSKRWSMSFTLTMADIALCFIADFFFYSSVDAAI